MSALSELLDGAIREDAVRLNGAAFATDRFGAVRGRVARRRAARSAGVGGASVLGIGVLAVGGSQLAGGGFGFGGPGSSATVSCTTSTPTAVAQWTQLTYVPGVEPGSFVPSVVERNGLTVTNGVPTINVTDDATGQTSFVDVLDEGIEVRVRAAGVESDVSPAADGTYVVRLPDGRSVALRITLAAGVPRGDGPQTADYRVPGVEVAIDPPEPNAVTCATTTPEPSASSSESPSASPSADSSNSTVPTPNPTGSAALYDSPFQCGFEFPSASHSTSVVSLRMFSLAAAELTSDVFDRLVEARGSASTGLAFQATLGGDAIDAQPTADASVVDPGNPYPNAAPGDELPPPDPFGMSFVAVRNGVVVGTIASAANPDLAPVFLDLGAPNNKLRAYLIANDNSGLDALTACEGSSLSGNDVTVVAVAGYRDPTNQTVYAWSDGW